MKNYLLTLMSGLVALGVTSCGKPAYTQPDAPHPGSAVHTRCT